MRLYDTTKWKKKRKRFARKSRYMCELCLREGKHESAELVHHIVPIELSDTLKLTDYNLISVCWRCHETLHKRQSHKLTARGIGLVRELVQQSYIPPSILKLIERG